MKFCKVPFYLFITIVWFQKCPLENDERTSVLFHIQFWQDFFARVTEKNAICYLRLVSNFNSSNSCTNRMNGNYDFHVFILIAYSYFPPFFRVSCLSFFFHFLTFIFRFGLFVSSEPWDVWQQPSVSSSGVHFVYPFPLLLAPLVLRTALIMAHRLA